MRVSNHAWAGASALVLLACATGPQPEREPMGKLPDAVTTARPEWIPFRFLAGRPTEPEPNEPHLAELRQLTFDGRSGHAAWSPDGKRLIFEAAPEGGGCSRIFVLDLGDGTVQAISPSGGWASGGAFGADGPLFAHTPETPPGCASGGGLPDWSLLPRDILRAGPDPSPLVESPGFDGELFVAPGGGTVFTSTRDGDPELYVASAEPRRITHARGYDGGAALSPDGTRLVWQSERPPEADAEAYAASLASGRWRPRSLRIELAGSAGQHPLTVLDNGRLNLQPTFLPDGQRILFASDLDAEPEEVGSFELYLLDPRAPESANDETILERVTFSRGFDGAPRFSPDGRHLAFTSSRGTTEPGATNLFVARWRE